MTKCDLFLITVDFLNRVVVPVTQNPKHTCFLNTANIKFLEELFSKQSNLKKVHYELSF